MNKIVEAAKGRDLEKNPYSPDEERVVQWMDRLGIGGGDDPIGFLLASHDLLARQKRDALEKVAKAATALYVARNWMPVAPIEQEAKDEVSCVNSVLRLLDT